VRAALALWVVAAAGCAQIAGLQDPQPAVDSNGCSHTCDLEDNCGCTSTQTCSWNGTTGDPYCRAAAGTAKLGETCVKDDDCELGTSCVFGECRRYCVGSATCGSTTCTADFTPYVPVKVCSDTCTPVSNAGCPGTSCLIIQGGNAAYCLAGESIAAGVACDAAPFQCIPGAVCHNEGGGSLKCRVQCDPAGTACAVGTCTPAADLIVGGTQYGVCI
jgi:hypothetical protein